MYFPPQQYGDQNPFPSAGGIGQGGVEDAWKKNDARYTNGTYNPNWRSNYPQFFPNARKRRIGVNPIDAMGMMRQQGWNAFNQFQGGQAGGQMGPGTGMPWRPPGTGGGNYQPINPFPPSSGGYQQPQYPPSQRLIPYGR